MRWLTMGFVVALMLVPEDANAQWRGRGNRWYGPSYGRGYYGGYYSPGWGVYGNNWGVYGNYGFGYSPRYYYTYPQTYYYDSSPGTFTYSSPRTSLYYDPQEMPVISDRQARVQVRVQDPNDELTVQGQVMPGTGLIRDFVSPELTAGKEYTYTISIRRSGSTTTTTENTRKLDVRAGGSFMVDFTEGTSTPSSSQPIP
jgi:uncharacterized protein (TIGR03000 family)